MSIAVRNYSTPNPISANETRFLCGNPSCPPHPITLCPEELRKLAPDGSYLGCASICTAVNDASMRSKSPILTNIYTATTNETRDANGTVRTRGGLPLKDLVCCACGDGKGGCEVDHSSNFCCSPYIPHYDLNIVGGRCFHEDWPLPNVNFMNRIKNDTYWMSRFNSLGLSVNYASIFKVVCPEAYSWQFDDFSSTFQCRDADYVVDFCGKNSTNFDYALSLLRTPTPTLTTTTIPPTTPTPTTPPPSASLSPSITKTVAATITPSTFGNTSFLPPVVSESSTMLYSSSQVNSSFSCSFKDSGSISPSVVVQQAEISFVVSVVQRPALVRLNFLSDENVVIAFVDVNVLSVAKYTVNVLSAYKVLSEMYGSFIIRRIKTSGIRGIRVAVTVV
ncbi:hypothetical protein AKO1_007367, partial [Acrasis kona]